MINREAWLEERKNGIDRTTGVGASEIAAALGLSQYTSGLALFLEKTRAVDPFAGNIATDVGKILEPYVLQKFTEASGQEVIGQQEVFPHPTLPFVWATIDGRTEQPAVVEAKTTAISDGWGEPGTDAIPPGYLLQVQTQLLCTGYQIAYVPVLFGTRTFAIYNVEADPELQEMISDGAAEFWKLVVSGTPPEPDFESRGEIEIIRKLYCGTNGQRIVADDSLERWYHVMEQARHRATEYEKAAESAKAHLLWEMGENALLAFQDGKAMRRKETKRKGFTVEASTYIDARIVKDEGAE